MPSGFFALFDDIAVLMDDVATMSKMATKKTAGILADDLAVNAEKASGFVSKRELPILWKITKGSFLNKVIILPIAFLLSAYLPWAIVPILLLGGTYLAYEGVEKIIHYIFHRDKNKAKAKLVERTPEEAAIYEREKIKSAIIVDFILSAEIVFIALGTVVEEDLSIQVPVVTVVALIATIGVYGLVALLVRMDDFGYNLIAKSKSENTTKAKFGLFLVNTLPLIIKGLTFFGTLAMVLVGGGIYVHNVHAIHDWVHSIPTILGEFLIGLVVGAIAVAFVTIFKKIIGKKPKVTV
jgi:predicted DNA repair protein MutK